MKFRIVMNSTPNHFREKLRKKKETNMKRTERILLISVAFFMAIGVCSAPAWAGGLASYEFGTPDVGLASAGWAARAQDASTVFKNPAGMSLLEKSELQVGAQAGYANLKFSPDSGTTATGNDGGYAIGWFPGGSLFYVQKITPDLSVGVGALSYLGASLKYDDNWVGRYYAQEVTLIGYTFTPAVSYRITDWLSVGAGLNAMYGTYKQTAALHNLESGLDGQLKIEDNNWGFGANAGVIFQPFEGTRIGVDYLSELKLDFKDTPQFSGIGPGLTAVLQRLNASNTQLQLGMYVPQMVMASIYQELGSKWAVMGNVGWQQWSRFGQIDVTLVNQNANSLTANANFQDTWHGAGGVMFKAFPDWTFTAGVAYDSSAVKDQDRTVLFPIGETYRFGAGVQWQLRPTMNLGFSYEYALSPDLSVDQFRGPLAGRVSGDYPSPSINFLALNFRWQL
jgi:long-chain fatty acid transport protein